LIIEKVIAAAVEPLIDDVLALEKRVADLTLTPGPPGPPGKDADILETALALQLDGDFREAVRGKAGEHGKDGAGIDAPVWIEGEVYRQGTTVIANLGQHFRALRDTATTTDDGAHWQRVGTYGFRHRGAYKADACYVEGDLFVKDFGTFCIVRGAPVLLAGRGAKGERGAPGARGDPGECGTDGATIIGAQVQGFKLVLVQQSAGGAIDHIEADFTPAFNELVREAVAAEIAGAQI
jgi:hypothetical protein